MRHIFVILYSTAVHSNFIQLTINNTFFFIFWQIGSGAFSVVKKGTLKETGESYAIKIVNRKSLDKALESALRDEILILNEIKHNHIMRLYDTFATKNTCYLVTEYLEGGELFDRIVQKSTYSENEARDVCKTLFGAMKYLHDKRIAHRDLKPENLLLQYKDSDLELKIADFGFARNAPTEHSLKTVCGSPGKNFVIPTEVIFSPCLSNLMLILLF